MSADEPRRCPWCSAALPAVEETESVTCSCGTTCAHAYDTRYTETVRRAVNYSARTSTFREHGDGARESVGPRRGPGLRRMQ